jgi:hypothetical protein
MKLKGLLMSQQQLLNRAGDANTHIPSALQTPVSGLISWSAFNAGMAKTGVGLVDELATKSGWDKLQATLGLDSYDATEAGTLSLTAAAVTTWWRLRSGVNGSGRRLRWDVTRRR